MSQGLLGKYEPSTATKQRLDARCCRITDILNFHQMYLLLHLPNVLITAGIGDTGKMQRIESVQIQSVSVASTWTSSEGVIVSGASHLLCRFYDIHKSTE